MERMPPSPYVICLGDAERAELESLSRRASAPFRLVLRLRIVLLAAAGTLAQREFGVKELAIVADPEYHAATLYRSVGFELVEQQVQVGLASD